MTLNPRDYDLDELRRLARERDRMDGDAEDPIGDIDVAVGESDRGGAATESFRAGLYRELLPFVEGTVEKPYLATLPAAYGAEFLIFEWLDFLLLHAGYRGAESALEYYVDVDWLTDDVADDLSTYLVGLDEEGTGDMDALDVEDHLLSLVYIAKLRAMA